MTLTLKRLVEVKGMARYMRKLGLLLAEVCEEKYTLIKLWTLGCTL